MQGNFNSRRKCTSNGPWSKQSWHCRMNMELPSSVKKMLNNNLMCHQGTMMENSSNASLTCRWLCKNQILLRLWALETRETLPRQVEMRSGTATLEHRQLTENQPHSRIWSNSGIFAEWVENTVHTATHKKFIWGRKGHSVVFIIGPWNNRKKNLTEGLNLIPLLSWGV